MYLGVDIGGSHISAALISQRKGEMNIALQKEASAPHDLGKNTLLDRWVDLMNDIIAENDIQGVGISIPGAFDYENGIALYNHGKFVALYELDLLAHFRNHLNIASNIPIQFVNDAEAFALGEYGKGSIQGIQRALVITLGTGFGASFIFDGRCIKEGEHIPKGGELYHLEYKEGRIADEFFSTRGLIRQYESRSGQKLENVKELAQEATQGNASALKTFEQFGKDLAEFLFPFISKLKIETLAIGGNISLALDLFSKPLIDHYGPDQLSIKQTQLGSEAPLYGAISPFTNKNYGL